MSIIASSMRKEAIAALKRCRAKPLETAVVGFRLYIVRLLAAHFKPRVVKEIGLTNKRMLGIQLWRAVENGGHATKISMLTKRQNEELLEKISQLSGLAISMFESSMEALFKHDFNLAEAVIEKISQVHKLEKDTVLCSHTAKADEIVNLRLIIESVRRTAEYATDISEVVLNLNVESVLS
jgi:phosphate uptake regulator